MRNKKKQWLKVYIFLLIISTVFIMGSLGYLTLTSGNKNNIKVQAINQIIPPYYSPEVFQKPKFIGRLPQAAVATSTVPSYKYVNLPILMYHYIEYTPEKADLIRKRLTINPTIFEKQLITLKQAGYQTYFVRDIPNILSGSLKPAEKSLVLTFDDGYKDFYTIAFPLLKKYQMKATVYIIYDTIGGQAYLDSEQIKELINSGLVEIGSHTLDHVYLSKMPLSLADKQIKESKLELEKKFKIKVSTFAYPYGAFSAEIIKLVEQAGYTAAVSVIAGRLQSEENLFYLSRLRSSDRFGPQLINFIEK
jgi:peptidoglycan/xylan/chitin deacetylase (PgdA/CDA1 family)